MSQWQREQSAGVLSYFLQHVLDCRICITNHSIPFNQSMNRFIICLLVLAALSTVFILYFTKTLPAVSVKIMEMKSKFHELQDQRWTHFKTKFYFLDFQILSQSKSLPARNRTIVFQCIKACGGLADRFRGLPTAYFFLPYFSINN